MERQFWSLFLIRTHTHTPIHFQPNRSIRSIDLEKKQIFTMTLVHTGPIMAKWPVTNAVLRMNLDTHRHTYLKTGAHTHTHDHRTLVALTKDILANRWRKVEPSNVRKKDKFAFLKHAFVHLWSVRVFWPMLKNVHFLFGFTSKHL